MVLRQENYDLTNLQTPVDADVLADLLSQSDYDKVESQFLIQGFKFGFSIGYQGPVLRQSRARNIPFQPGIGDKYDMWNKLMKEVQAGRIAGPFDQIPYQNYMQSPIGLVPKAGGKTRLIFHLSYDFADGRSLNHHTPKSICTVQYNDLDAAVSSCLTISKLTPNKSVFLAKTDLMSAFRMLPIQKNHWRWLIMTAEDPTEHNEQRKNGLFCG